MKRIHLFEFEDQEWFPDWIRKCMTRMIVVMHNLLGTKKDLVLLVDKALQHSEVPVIIDLCSGSGGPMIAVFKELKESKKNLTLKLTDLYPNKEMAEQINSKNDSTVEYITDPVDATSLDHIKKGVRTMICSLHHMKPQVAHNILKDAKEARQPICIYEISDNSFPKMLWWVVLPINFIMAFFITPFVRPLSWRHLIFTYIIPVIPFFFAWDGAVSNVRTYTLKDMEELIKGLYSEDYKWEKGRITGKAKKLYLLGLPLKN